jgi:cytoskeleton protein RodZ
VFEIGNTLREARLRQDLDFPEIELATKVRAKYLRALEDEHFDILPTQTYVKGFLRTYAEYLGLDGQLYVDEYNSRFLVPSVDEDAPARPRRSRARPRRERRVERNAIMFAIVGIGVVTALIIAAWRFGGGSPTSIPNLKQTKPAVARTPKTAHLVVRAARGSSLLQVRLSSATGRPVYQGTLDKGQSQSFTAKRLWLSIGTPENVSLLLDNRPLRVGGAKPCLLLVTRQGPVQAGPGSC